MNQWLLVASRDPYYLDRVHAWLYRRHDEIRRVRRTRMDYCIMLRAVVAPFDLHSNYGGLKIR